MSYCLTAFPVLQKESQLNDPVRVDWCIRLSIPITAVFSYTPVKLCGCVKNMMY